MLNDRMYGILKELNSNVNSYVNSNEISESLGVSSRTIKRDIKGLIDIVKEKGAYIEASNKGYKLIVIDDEIYKEFIKETFDSAVLNNNGDYVNQIIELLFCKKYINQDQLASSLYISKSSINKAMISVKHILSQDNISVHNKPHYGYIVDGDEVSIRNFMVKYLIKNLEDSSIKLSSYVEESIARCSYRLIKDITQILKEHEVLKNDMVISYITKYVLVTIIRCKNGANINLSGDINIALENRVIKVAKDIASKAQECFDIKLSFEDIIYIAYIIGNSSNETSNKENKEDFYKKVVNQCLDEIKAVYAVDFLQDKMLTEGLVNHLYTSFSRYYLNANLGNPLITMIKSKYIEAYNYSILFSKIFHENYNLKMSEEDIGYIALHFAAALERNIMNNKIKVIIVCGSGLGTAELMKVRIMKRLPNINVIQTYPSYMLDVLDLSGVDFIISTIDIKKTNIDKKIISISPLLQEEDIEKINDYVSEHRDFEHLQKLMKDDLFFYNIKADTKEKVIDFLCEKMINRNSIDESTAVAIKKREEISPTEINELVAIPHCIAKTGRESVIAIGILDKPILWDKTYVQLIFLGALNPKIKEDRSVFTMIYKLTKKVDKVKILVDVDSLNDFKKKLLK